MLGGGRPNPLQGPCDTLGGETQTHFLVLLEKKIDSFSFLKWKEFAFQFRLRSRPLSGATASRVLLPRSCLLRQPAMDLFDDDGLEMVAASSLLDLLNGSIE